MDALHSNTIAKRACTRCRNQKRKCDRELPSCSLCIHLRRKCKYETRRSSSSVSVTSGSPSTPDHTKNVLSEGSRFTPTNIKASMIQSLAGRSSTDVSLLYFQSIEPWFPVLGPSRMTTELSCTWDDATVDFALLCLTIVLVCTHPKYGPGIPDSAAIDFQSLYLLVKSHCSLLEGLGINSLETVQARLLLTLFEMVHGMYPAAYITIGNTVRAADALTRMGELKSNSSLSKQDSEKWQQYLTTWCGVLILDRYIAFTASNHPPVTRGRPFSDLINELHPCEIDTEKLSPSLKLFSRLFEASNLLEKVHLVVCEPTKEFSFHIKEIVLTVQTLKSFEAVLQQDMPENSYLYAGGMILCLIGIVRVYENGTKASPSDQKLTECHDIAFSSLYDIIDSILKIAEPLTEPNEFLDFAIIPPFIIYLAYISADFLTGTLRMGDNAKSNILRLKSLRGILRTLGKRWLSGERYLSLLDEESTPKMLRAIRELTT